MKNGTVILFQGDSITDASRVRDVTAPNTNNGMGYGYANHIAAHLLADHPAAGLQIYNRGISGHRVVDLYARWRVDTINLQPDVLSILIGINDTWHEFMHQNGVEVDRFAQVYRMMLDYTRLKLPQTHLVLCEPFALLTGVVQDAWMVEVAQRQQVVRQLAAEYKADFVPFQAMFDAALQEAPAPYWLPDGVHPSPAGHLRMARLWLKTVQDL